MSKKERFEVMMNEETGKWCIKDNEQLPSLLDNYKSCVRLNEFAEKVKDLQSQLAITEKALELMCEEELSSIGVDDKEDLMRLIKDYKQQANEVLENE